MINSIKYPKLYKAGPLEVYFNSKRFWSWIFFSFIHGAFCFFIPVLVIIFNCFFVYFFSYKAFDCSYNNKGFTTTHWFVSTLSFCLVMHIITIKLFLETSFYTGYNM